MVRGETNRLHEQYKTPKSHRKLHMQVPQKSVCSYIFLRFIFTSQECVLSQENDTDHPNLKMQVMFDTANKC